METHARPSILSYFTEKTKCRDPPFRLLPSGSAVKDPVTVGWRERFHFSSRISSKSRVLLAADPRPAIISYIGPTSASKPASPGFKFSKLDDWPFQEWNLPTRRTAQLFNCCAGKFRINYAWVTIPRNSAAVCSFHLADCFGSCSVCLILKLL